MPVDNFLASASTRLKSLLRSGRTPERAPRILIVDDEPPIVGFVRRVLEQCGYEVAAAESGAQALEIAAGAGPFDALVTDLMMPAMSGDELARRLRATTPDLKVLYLTGFSDQLFKEKATLWSAEAFLEKPTTVKGLKEAVALLLFGTVRGAERPDADSASSTA